MPLHLICPNDSVSACSPPAKLTTPRYHISEHGSSPIYFNLAADDWRACQEATQTAGKNLHVDRADDWRSSRGHECSIPSCNESRSLNREPMQISRGYSSGSTAPVATVDAMSREQESTRNRSCSCTAFDVCPDMYVQQQREERDVSVQNADAKDLYDITPEGEIIYEQKSFQKKNKVKVSIC
eukprot:gnl/MRDRNA2_/MRDRNA2_147870_c0_seq1.p1 gnl/MRDRNA2_/MRDRNA2_147870_c0~~gnl/MRDRNA2_/MRDRNA2_147870_c0_seq1.p1  ORF type:complete len:183 (-),score=33.53 gnl/MRDRNA2_/MRDRNA2_147870_c0_seq1:135-683(-)